MKKVFLSIVALATLVVLPMTLNAAVTVPLESSGHAYIISAIQIQNSTVWDGDATTLEFGTISKSSSDGSLLVNHDGTVTPNGVSTVGEGQHPAAFVIRGEEGAEVTINVPVSFPISNGENSITVTTNKSCGATATLGDADFKFTVGGTLPVVSAQATGDYNGNFSVSVNYN